MDQRRIRHRLGSAVPRGRGVAAARRVRRREDGSRAPRLHLGPAADAETRVIFVPPSYGLATVPAVTGTSVPDAVLLSRPASPSSRNVAERSRWASVDTPLAAAEVFDPVGSDRKMPTDR